jgi:uncharacterized protein involved in exopolysaccharide biosynthesis
MNEKENKEELKAAVQLPEEESQSLEDSIRKIKPYIDKLWKKKKQFLIFNGVVAVLAVLYLLFISKPYFTSSVYILPEYGNQSSTLASLSGLASMAGINVGDVPPNEIYRKILSSEKVLKEVMYNKYFTEKFEDSVNLIQYFEINSPDEDESVIWQERYKFLEARKILYEKLLKTDIDRVTTVLSLTVTMPEPKLSADVANSFAAALNNYITNDRQSYAREQSEYLFNRLNQVRDSLRFHEEQLKIFSENNRSITNSPQLLLEQNRLKRNVEIAQSVFIELTKQYELVKLEEVKDTPVVNIMEVAEPPVKKTGPRRKVNLIIILFFSGIFSAGYILFKDDAKKIVSYFKNNND